MTVYQKYEELIKTHYMQILDKPEWCKAFFRKAGMTEKDIKIKLFFLLLEKNIPLEIRKVTYGKHIFTDYEVAISVYTRIFDSLSVPNNIEDILITHIIEMIKVFKKCKVIEFEYFPGSSDYEITEELEPAITDMLEFYGTEILVHPERIGGYLNDISRNEISDYERKAFVVFITALNSKNVVLLETNENNKYFINVLRNALKSNKLTYEPLKRNDEMQTSATQIKRNYWLKEKIKTCLIQKH